VLHGHRLWECQQQSHRRTLIGGLYMLCGGGGGESHRRTLIGGLYVLCGGGGGE
jgi:hypothetical protein